MLIEKTTEEEETIEETVQRLERELDEEFAFLRPAAAPNIASAKEVPEQRVPPAAGENMEVASGWHQAMLNATGWNQSRNEKEITFEAELDEEISSLFLQPPAATATTLAAEAPAAAAATLTVARPEEDVPDQRVPAAATSTSTPTAAAAAAAEEVATVATEVVVAADPTASPTGVPQKEPNEGPTGTPGTMLPATAPPKIPPKPAIHARTWISDEMVVEQKKWGQKPGNKNNTHGTTGSAMRGLLHSKTNRKPPDIAPAVPPPPD